MTLRLQLFGVPSIEVDGIGASLPFERRHQLLVYLALRRDWVARAEIAALLWPDLPGKLAFANLRKLLFRGQGQAWGRAIEMEGTALRCAVGSDVADFEQAVREQRHADAATLRRGDLLRGYDDGGNEAWTAWLSFERERLRMAWRASALVCLDAGPPPAAAVALSARLLEADPLDEAALRAHVQALSAAGQGAQARQAYRDFATRLKQDLGLEPGRDLAALAESAGAASADRTARAAPVGTPQADLDEGFVGRAVELRRIGELLARGDGRLVTLLGPGGVGKTRLARRALSLHRAGFADGAFFVSLEDVVSGADMATRLARELGLPGKGAPAEQVLEHLQGRRALLVLDNFEQLVGDHAWLQRLLEACAGVRLLVTSRLRLALPGEWLVPVEGLPWPEPEDEDRAEAFDAVQLFLRAAQRVEPALVAGVEGADIVDICRQVGGLPLALELAASWTRLMSCSAIAAELREGTELLLAEDPARPARHASVERVFEQSWRLLSPVERETLMRLAVFRGGFAPAAARAVALGSLPVLGALVDKSLLRKDGPRLQLHPLVQQMAALRLAATPHREAAEAAHARYFLGWLEQSLAPVKAGEREALQALDADFDNCRRAWRVAIGQGTVEALGRGVRTLLHYAEHRGRFEEGLALLSESLASPAVQADVALHAKLRAHAAHLAFRLDHYAEAKERAAAALEASGDDGEVDTRLLALTVLGRCHLTLGELGDARRQFSRALRLSSASRDTGVRFVAMGSLALVERAAGNLARALEIAGEVLEEQRRRGDVPGQAQSHNAIAAMHLDRQQFEPAAVQLEAALALCDRHGFVNTRSMVLTNLTGVAMHLGRLGQAADYATRALEHVRATGNRGHTAFLRALEAGIAWRRGDFATARAALRESLEISTALGRVNLQVSALQTFAELLQAEGRTPVARRLVRFLMRREGANAADTAELAALLAAWPPTDARAATDDEAWPGWSLAELAGRVVAETDQAHEALIQAIGAA